jgi:hypothetical protein
MENKNLITKIQSDFAKSNPKIINSGDNTSTIQKTFSSKYTEDISDSDNDSDLTSYKNRNINMVNQLKNKESKTKSNVKSSQSKQKSSKNIEDEVNELVEKIEEKNTKKTTKNLKNKKEESESDYEEEQVENDENSGSSESVDEHQYEYTEEFKKKVKDFVKNDDRIRELQSELKVLNNAKKAAELEILKHLERLGESNINITGGKLRINQYESKEGLKEDLIKEALSEKIKDPKIIEFIFEKINEKRVANGKVQKSLKRTFERGGKKDKK